MKCTFGCKGDSDKIGVLIAQLGTPEAPTARALKPYLKQFLWDPRVIEGNRVLWWFVLNFIVLTKRPKRSAKLYKRIWTEEGSPLLVLTRRQTELVADSLSQVDPDIEVTFGMRYGEPSLECAVDDLIKRGCSRILLFPMYPQYSATSSASTYDVVFPHLLKRRWVPTLRVAEPFYSDPGYIEPQAERINRGLRAMQEPPEFLILSYHGIPQSYVDKGDTYCCMCTETTRSLMPLLEIEPKRVIQTFQSQFGNDPWLQPYTEESVIQMAKDGVKRIAVSCPGFVADCLETTDEIGTEVREVFEEHGGQHLEFIPCMNDDSAWINGLTSIINGEISSWLETAKRRREGKVVSCPVSWKEKVGQYVRDVVNGS